MKRIHIFAGLLILGAIALLISASGDMSAYAGFADAMHSEKKMKIAGQLSKDKEMYYNPEEDPNYFSFYLKDHEGVEKQVVLLAAKPQDFEMSEQVVVTGKMRENTFFASEILLKCPSKYKNEEIFIKSETEI